MVANTRISPELYEERLVTLPEVVIMTSRHIKEMDYLKTFHDILSSTTLSESLRHGDMAYFVHSWPKGLVNLNLDILNLRSWSFIDQLPFSLKSLTILNLVTEEPPERNISKTLQRSELKLHIDSIMIRGRLGAIAQTQFKGALSLRAVNRGSGVFYLSESYNGSDLGRYLEDLQRRVSRLPRRISLVMSTEFDPLWGAATGRTLCMVECIKCAQTPDFEFEGNLWSNIASTPRRTTSGTRISGWGPRRGRWDD